MDKNTAIIITKDNKAFLNFNKPVGALMVAKIAEIFEIMDDDISRDRIDASVAGNKGYVEVKYAKK